MKLKNGKIYDPENHWKPKRRRLIPLSWIQWSREIAGHPKSFDIIILWKLHIIDEVLEKLYEAYPNHKIKRKDNKVPMLKEWVKHDDPFLDQEFSDYVNTFSNDELNYLFGPRIY